MFGWFKSKPKWEVPGCEEVAHVVRNSLLGMLLEERRLRKAQDRHHQMVAAYARQIEDALKRAREPAVGSDEYPLTTDFNGKARG
jgi:hypothetical protein